MKTVLVFRAADIFIRDLVINKLEENGIKTFGSDSSINVIYPATPNLYFSGASAVIDGYRILVTEEDSEKAKRLIAELERDLSLNDAASSQQLIPNPLMNKQKARIDYERKFYFFAIFAFFLPVVPLVMALYFLAKMIKLGRPNSKIKFIIALVLILGNLGMTYLMFFYLFNL